MLLTKEVEVKARGSNIPYYESKGYYIPREKEKNKNKMRVKEDTKIKVKIEDLSDTSSIRVLINCDFCDKEPWEVSWRNYLHCKRKTGHTLCRSCASKRRGGRKIQRTLYDWCVKNNRRDILNRWDSDKNLKSPKEVSCSSNESFYFKCNNNPKHKSIKRQINGLTTYNLFIVCKTCNSLGMFLSDKFGEKSWKNYWDYSKNGDINPFDISRGTETVNFYIFCDKKEYHGSYKTNAKRYSNRNSGNCPYCSLRKVHVLDSVGTVCPKSVEFWSGKNKSTPYEHGKNSKVVVYWKCENKIHQDYKRQIKRSQEKDFRCPKCVAERKESFLQEKVRTYFETKDFEIKHERHTNIKCLNPKTGFQLPYDNEVVEKDFKLIVEVNGQQHYSECAGAWFDKNFDLSKRKLYDRYKRIYAKSQGYEYLEIPYWADNKNEDWRVLIENKLKEIKRKEVRIL